MKILSRYFPSMAIIFYAACFSAHAQCVTTPPVVSLTGNSCTNNVLTVQCNTPVDTIHWILNGQTIATYHATFSPAVTVAGSATGISGSTPSLLSHPDRFVVDDAGNLYIPDMNNDRVQKWAPGATQGVTVAGGNGRGSGMNQFNRPTSVALDAQGNIYITDQNNNRIQKWEPGAVTGTTFSSDINMPTDIFIDKQGNVYASAQQDLLVKKWPAGATTPITVVNGAGFMAAATGIHVDDQGGIYVCDANNNRVLKFFEGSPSYQVVAGTGVSGLGLNQFTIPLDVFVDCKGNMYIADYWNARVMKWAPGATSGIQVAPGNGFGSGPDQLDWTIGVTVDKDNNVYMADAENDRVQKKSYTIQKTFTAVNPGVYQAQVITSGGAAFTQTIVVEATKYPSISISSDVTNTCEGLPVNFTAAITDGGSQPVYQWLKNGEPVGTNSNVYAGNNFAEGDIISCILRSSETCIDQPSVTSNSIKLQIAKSGSIEFGDDFGICPGDQISFTAPAGFSIYEWNDGSSGSSFITGNAGLYWLKVTDACGQVFADSVNISIHSLAKNFLPANFAMCSYDKIGLNSRIAFQTYLWNTGSTASNITINTPGTYILEGLDQNGCVNRDTVLVTLKQCAPMELYVPTAFTPDNNGLNDILKPVIAGQLKQYEFVVYNRYGQVVFRTKDPSKGWDGTLKGIKQDSNVFIWQCSYQLDGRDKKIEKGTITLIR